MQTQPTGTISGEFMMFMRSYQDMVFSTASRLTGDDGQAEDIAQEVFLRAYEHFAQLHGNPTAGGWLKTVTTNLTLNHLTRYRRKWRMFSELMEYSDEGPAEIEWQVPDTLLADVDADQRRQLLDDALRQLPQHQRVALVLYHFEELSYQDIAQKLHVSLAKVKTDIHRARAALASLLGARGLEGGSR